MPEHHAHETTINGAEPVNETVAFEAEDVSVSGVERVGMGLAIVVLIVLAVAAGMFHFLTREQPVGTPEIAAGMRAGEHPLPPQPRLQGLPGDTVPPPEQQREFQAAAAAELHSYGWVDGQQSVAHIPIEDAMDQLVKNGLPQAAPPQTAAAAQTKPQAKPQASAARGKKAQ
jgi:hypothetical protein